MMFWADFPLEQWIEIQEDPSHLHPWSVVITGFVRARYTTKEEAEGLVDRIHAAFLADKEPQDGTRGTSGTRRK